MSDLSTEELVEQVEALQEQVEQLKASRPGRRAKKIVVSERGVCGVDPTRDAATCPDASLYRRQLGCLGTACVGLASEYYRNYRSKNKDMVEDDEA